MFGPRTGPRVERVDNTAYQVLGLPELSPLFATHETAQRWLERALAKARPAHKPKERSCMCCQTAFVSEGFHHRLCGRCRGRSDGGSMSISSQSAGKVRRAARS